MLALILWGSIFAALFYYYAMKPMSYWRNRGVIQGKAVWLFGDFLPLVLRTESGFDWFQKMYKAFPNLRYNGAYQMTVPILMIRDPELIKLITVKNFDYFLDHRNFIPDGVDPLFENNLFSLKGQKWRDMRPILSPSFTSSKMKSMFVIMCECLETFMKYFLDKNEDVIDVEMKDIFTRLGNDIIASTAFGLKVDSLAQPKNEFYLMGKKATNFSGFFMFLKIMAFQVVPSVVKLFDITFFSKDVSKFFYGLIDETVKTRDEQKIVRPDMINLLMEARKGKVRSEENVDTVDTGFATVQEADIETTTKSKPSEITNQVIAAQAMIFFFAGFDSVTNLMSFMAYELGINPDIQDRLREEIKETNKACNGKLTYEALMKMKYMDMVVSETLRKWPNNPFTDRVCTKPYTIQPVTPEERPVNLAIGDVVMISILGLHYDPQYFPNPEKFDPERFNDENKSKINPYVYLPFGVGPRNCIGSRFALMETKILFYYLLTVFEIVPTKNTPIPAVIDKKTLNLSIEGGFKFGLKKIED